MKSSLFIGLLLFLTGCGGLTSTTTTTTPIASVIGAWQITAKSNRQPGFSTLIEGNLQQVTSAAVSTATVSASGADQLVLVGQHPTGGLFFGGLCPGSTTENLTGTLSTFNALSLTLTEGAATYTLTGTVNKTGTSMSGTYAYTAGNCPDSGTFSGVQVPALAGTYAGNLDFNGNVDSATLTLTEGVPSSFTAAITLTGADTTSATLNGLVVGNVFSVQGTLGSQAVNYYGYYAFNEKAIYLVDATSDTPLGTLFVQ
ncbi:MAG TPA: hypothetical protein VH079_01630 [Terriglobales bacterium]|jgi:hypothetical protein|nr:hypothetical protein [Terriglobales bacterium]